MKDLMLRQLSKTLDNLTCSQVATPKNGWIYTIRHALGMTSKQLGVRLGTSQQAARDIERREMAGSVTLTSLEEAAKALHCKLVYHLIPCEPIEQIIEKQINKKAMESLKYVAHHMTLEDQQVSSDEQNAQLSEQKARLRSGKTSRMWE